MLSITASKGLNDFRSSGTLTTNSQCGVSRRRKVDCSLEIKRRIKVASQSVEMLQTLLRSKNVSAKTKIDVLASCAFYAFFMQLKHGH